MDVRLDLFPILVSRKHLMSAYCVQQYQGKKLTLEFGPVLLYLSSFGEVTLASPRVCL